MYFEAGEEGGEVKLVPASEAIKVTAEPSSASGALAGPRLSIAGSFAPEQTKNVDNFTVRSLQSNVVEFLCRAEFNKAKKINCYCNHLSCLFWSKLSFCINNIIQADKKDMKCGSQGQGESDRSHSQSRSSSSDKVKCRSIGAGASGGHYRRLGVVSMPPEPGQDQEAGTNTGGRVRAEVARRISLDDLSAAFQGEQFGNCF